MRSVSSGISNVLLLEQVANDPRLTLSPMQMSTQTCHHLGSSRGPTFAERIGFDVSVANCGSRSHG